MEVSGQKQLRYPLDRRLGGPQDRSGRGDPCPRRESNLGRSDQILKSFAFDVMQFRVSNDQNIPGDKECDGGHKVIYTSQEICRFICNTAASPYQFNVSSYNISDTWSMVCTVLCCEFRYSYRTESTKITTCRRCTIIQSFAAPR
jgi:hypothetical protein